MEVTGNHRMPASRKRVWEALNDPDVLQRAIPGCESIERVSDSEMRARITASVGPVRARFDTTLAIEEPDPPARYVLTGEAKAGAAGFGRGRASVELGDAGDETDVAWRADFKVGGRLAQVGSRLVTGATKKTADEFFSNLARELTGEAPAEAGVPRKRDKRAQWVLAAVALTVIAVLLWLLLA